MAVIAPSGRLLGKMLVPAGYGVANLCFAGKDRRKLCVLSETAVWVVPMAVSGVK